MKRLPPLRRLEAKLRGSVIAIVDPDLEESEAFDDVKDADWEASVEFGVLLAFCTLTAQSTGSKKEAETSGGSLPLKPGRCALALRTIEAWERCHCWIFVAVPPHSCAVHWPIAVMQINFPR